MAYKDIINLLTSQTPVPVAVDAILALRTQELNLDLEFDRT